jgi:hypothetical protein
MAKTCNYNFNGDHRSGYTPEECAKLKARFDKLKEQKQREFDSISGRSRDNRKETPKPNKKKKKVGKVVAKIKEGIKRGIARRKKKRQSKRSYNPYD